MSHLPTTGCVCFGLFQLNLRTGELRKEGMQVKLVKHAFRVLALLLERPGELRSREEIRQQLWGADTFVNFEQSLNKAIHQLRGALGDSASNPHYIETLAGRGYRFVHSAQAAGFALRRTRNLASVAVLPFSTEPANPEMDIFEKRFIERIIDRISPTPGIRVFAYSTVQHYRDEDVDPRAVGLNLGAHIVASGEMIRFNEELLLHLELIDVEDGTQLWGAQF